jgi:hypothetical protein
MKDRKRCLLIKQILTIGQRENVKIFPPCFFVITHFAALDFAAKLIILKPGNPSGRFAKFEYQNFDGGRNALRFQLFRFDDLGRLHAPATCRSGFEERQNLDGE